MYQISTFGPWPQSVHAHQDQQTRIKSATGDAVTPDSVDRKNQTCSILGSGKLPYHVTLSSCTCDDFHRRGLPCKHIYRLAAELKLIDIPLKWGKSRGHRLENRMYIEESVAAMEALSEPAQKELCDILRFLWDGSTPFVSVPSTPQTEELKTCLLLEWEPAPATDALPALSRVELFKLVSSSTSDAPRPSGRSSAASLREWIIQNDLSLACGLPRYTRFSLVLNFSLCARDSSRYLDRKFYSDSDGLPPDKITQLLYRYHPERNPLNQ